MKITTFPIVRDIWARIRLKKILQKHDEIASFWKPIIDQYFEGNIEHYNTVPKRTDLLDQKIIWQYWGQGFNEDLPEVVKMCIQSVDENKGEYSVIRLSDETISEYLDLPQFVLEKRNNPEFNRTFFSDLLRLCLLNAYGGVWLDATIFLTGKLPSEYTDLDYFVFQRDENEKYRKYWEKSYAYYWGWNPNFKVRMLNSVIFAKKNDAVVATLVDLMLYYWKTQDHIIDYFFFQILYNELMSEKLADKKCLVVSDTIPHALQNKLGGGYQFASYDEIKSLTPIHKMTYKNLNNEQFMKIIARI